MAHDTYRPARGVGYYQASMSMQQPRKCIDCQQPFVPQTPRAKRCPKCRKTGRWA